MTWLQDDASELVAQLGKPSAYVNDPTERVEVVETHISWIFLTDKFAYKVKKPIANEFIDYQSLERREHFCHKEVQLDGRYAPQLYCGVVAIARSGQSLLVEGEGTPVEYAVKMHRFPLDALLSNRISADIVNCDEIRGLAERLAEFHLTASRAKCNAGYGNPNRVLDDQLQNLDALEASEFNTARDQRTLEQLRQWTNKEFAKCQVLFERRCDEGWVRECHGDLHAGNVVLWNGQLTPFDGVEFNESFRWIDTSSDFAFLAMDLAVRRQTALSNQLVSSYLERLGDYSAVKILRWYLVYRACVRAKVASMVLTQHAETSEPFRIAFNERKQLLAYALAQTQLPAAKLFIMHGLSGSGKSTYAELLVREQAAIRIRADVERKRLLGLQPQDRLSGGDESRLYSPSMNSRTYGRLYELADEVLTSGFSVVVDATFLKVEQRSQFSELARRRQVPFRILACQADRAVLEQRLSSRRDDPSDADIRVLRSQIERQEPLTANEKRYVSLLRHGN